ncbi:NHLP bacteriocin export ABC transporter permease/ATPase subunit [Cronbergia sp. UHCC 0137]|uniref:NHLP bacteriocin export ABC transporter permease/ATPase subunit n=1 Tax=Cronbergia sp. UHCC 0137 TaxID=3110239 RepID=UPI002B1FAEC6|nr:NHLP bacteriocin export ABC transporter permease/ATPase subunit [Cronbergia sp. UHCC 0137]MEA5616255.1 NHLP bacteriocin export ABC transporter permease/ATPase subunit [Cronbergia sp. UHCC 0137]
MEKLNNQSAMIGVSFFDSFNLPSEEIAGNSSFLLTDLQTTRWIESGTIAIFAVKSTGERRYLFSAIAGELLLGIEDPTFEYQILAVAIEPSQLRELTLTQWQTVQSRELNALIQTWLNHLTTVFPQQNSSWLLQDYTSEAEIFLLQIHQQFLQQLAELEQQEYAIKLAQFEQRQRLNQSALNCAVNVFSSVLQPIKSKPFIGDHDLLIAAEAVGRALGIEIRLPVQSEKSQCRRDPLEAIAHASQIRTRRIFLTKHWWKQDCGPMLAYLEADHRPVAILPKSPNRYKLFDPQTGTDYPLNASLANQLSSTAYIFYRPFPEKIKSAWEVFNFAVYGRKRDAIALILSGIIATLLGMLTPQATGIIIDQAIPNSNRGLLLQIAIGLIAASFGIAIFQFTQRIRTLRLQTLTNSTIQAALWDRLLKLKIRFFRQYSTGQLLSRVAAINQIRQILGTAIVKTLFNSIFSLLNLGLLFIYNFALALVAIGLASITILIMITAAHQTRKKLRLLEENQGQLSGILVEMIGAVSKLRVAGAENRAFAYWTNHYRQKLQLTLHIQWIEDMVLVSNRLLTGISPLLMFAIVVTMIQPALSIGTFLAFNVAFAIFIQGVTNLSNTLIDILEIGILWERVLPILQAEPEISTNKIDPGVLLGNVTLEEIVFRYRPDKRPAINNISLTAQAGEFIALVGASGSGKSTLVRLLLGFETPESGKIYYDGQDLSELDIGTVRRQLGVVLQNGRIHSASLFENIAAGGLITIDEAWEAARMAGLADDIQAMPMQMHTIISEAGSNLSGGQRQRLLIARSLVLKPKILILDEATSALDNHTQAIVTASLDQLCVTRIVIAHRLSTIRKADRIYVLDQGQVIQQGTFDQLVSIPGLFAQLMSCQLPR